MNILSMLEAIIKGQVQNPVETQARFKSILYRILGLASPAIQFTSA